VLDLRCSSSKASFAGSVISEVVLALQVAMASIRCNKKTYQHYVWVVIEGICHAHQHGIIFGHSLVRVWLLFVHPIALTSTWLIVVLSIADQVEE